MKNFLFLVCLGLIGLNVKAQIPNGDFESWINDSTATGWTTTANVVLTLNFAQKTTGNSGYGMQINSKLIDLGITTIKAPGFATLGKITINMANNTGQTTGGIPCSAKPAQMKGYYKYIPDSTDMMAAAIILTKYNTSLSKTDTVGIGSFSSPNAVSTFTQFTVDLSYPITTEDPDTMNITLVSSNPLTPRAHGVLVVDDLVLLGGNIGIDELPVDLIQSIQPNPTSGKFITILNNMKSGILKVYNSLGTKVYSNPEYLNGSQIDLGLTNPGIYFVSIQNGTKHFVKKLIVN
ncbi:MAG: T9SS type A sorting domain-containing protein [Bacteroidota bacterium]